MFAKRLLGYGPSNFESASARLDQTASQPEFSVLTSKRVSFSPVANSESRRRSATGGGRLPEPQVGRIEPFREETLDNRRCGGRGHGADAIPITNRAAETFSRVCE